MHVSVYDWQQSRGYVRSSSSGSSGGAKRGAAPPGKTASATAELNLLAELMGSAAKSAADEEEESGDARGAAHAIKPFKINLFPEDPFAEDGWGTRRQARADWAGGGG